MQETCDITLFPTSEKDKTNIRMHISCSTVPTLEKTLNSTVWRNLYRSDADLTFSTQKWPSDKDFGWQWHLKWCDNCHPFACVAVSVQGVTPENLLWDPNGRLWPWAKRTAVWSWGWPLGGTLSIHYIAYHSAYNILEPKCSTDNMQAEHFIGKGSIL